MEAQERENKPISPNLPNTEYKYLKLWYDTLDSKDTLGEYYLSLHNKIEASDYSELTIKESAILKEILKSRIINKQNLYDYFVNCEKVVNTPSLLDKFKGSLDKSKTDVRYQRIVDAVDSEEDIALKKERLRLFKLSNTIYKSFDKGDFLAADDFLEKDPTLVDLPTYEKIKATYVQEYFKNTFQIKDQPFDLSLEQAEAMCNMNRISLLNSRAGTGKTRIIMAKILFLLSKEELKPESICLLSFDRKHTEKIIEMVSEIKPKSDVLTFDKLLAEIIGEELKPETETKESIVLSLLEKQKKASPEFVKNFYNFYLNDDIKINKKSFKNPSVYFQYVRNAKFLCLKGELVESLGEKWIADFLYENGIEYQYKKAFYPSKIESEDRIIADLIQRGSKIVYPDFFLPKYNILIEHSRINENEPDERNKVEFEKINSETWGHYRIRMQWKRDFWADEWRKGISGDSSKPEIEDIKAVKLMLETSLEQMTESREKFVDYLQGLLDKADVKFEKRDSKELFNDLWERNKISFTKLITSFCDRYQCSAIKDSKEFREKAEAFKELPNLMQFYDVGIRTKEMDDFETDQSQIVLDALNIVKKWKESAIIKNLKWILVDDFQDFTQGYYLLISEILKANPGVKLFLVGDNWQTLYRDKGSDSVFIEKVNEYFPEISVKTVPTNFRCKGSITQNSNKLMKRNAIPGMPAQSFDQDYTKSVFIEDVAREKLVNEEIDASIKVSDLGTRPSSTILTKYLFKCVERIKEAKDANILIVSKINNIYGMMAGEFLEELSKSLVSSGVYLTTEEANGHLSFSLMSETKPLETDILIVLQFTSDVIPTVNSSSGLFEVFGESLPTNITDQQRMLYVAMTRAKSKIYILTEKDKESEFLESLV